MSHGPRLTDDALAAALVGVRLPERPDTYFVWQIAVSEKFRGRGLAQSLIRDALAAHVATGVRYVEAHVGPDNGASAAMFRGLARSLGAQVEITPDFQSEDYPTEHGPEDLWRIGPFDLGQLRDAQTKQR